MSFFVNVYFCVSIYLCSLFVSVLCLSLCYCLSMFSMPICVSVSVSVFMSISLLMLISLFSSNYVILFSLSLCLSLSMPLFIIRSDKQCPGWCRSNELFQKMYPMDKLVRLFKAKISFNRLGKLYSGLTWYAWLVWRGVIDSYGWKQVDFIHLGVP